MRPRTWQPPVEPSPAEQQVLRRIKRARLFTWLRLHRHELFDQEFQDELGGMYADEPSGQPPVPPAVVALATILQAYTGASDDEVIESVELDRRWQVVLGCLDATRAPFAKGTLVAFRARLIEREGDRRLIERTVALYSQHTGRAAGGKLRVALDASPLWGAGRVEDTINLMGHALRKVLGVLARQQGWGLAAVAEQAGAEILAGSSLKAALDCDWDDPAARDQALGLVLDAIDAVEALVECQPACREDPGLAAGLAAARQVADQDVDLDAAARPHLRRGVAKDRRISIEDPQMRHGRKTRSLRVDGYKRHVARDLDTALIRAVALTAANTPEAAAGPPIAADLTAQDATLGELHIDRAYLSSVLVRDREPDLAIYCKAFPVRNGSRFAKTVFNLDFEAHTLTCPAGVRMPFVLGGKVQFPAATCRVCPLRERCTISPRGRSVQIHPDEHLLAELRQGQLTPAGRAKLRERVAVEHTLAHVGQWQGPRARYLGIRKNLFTRERVLNAAASSCQSLVSRVIVAGDSPPTSRGTAPTPARNRCWTGRAGTAAAAPRSPAGTSWPTPAKSPRRTAAARR